MKTDSSRPAVGSYGVALTFVFAGFIAFSYGFGIYLFPILSPDMRLDLGFSYAQMGYVAAGIQAGFIVSSLLSGILAPKIGELRYIFGSMLLCGVCLVALTWVETSLQAALILAVAGFVPAAAWTPMVVVVRRFITYNRRGTVFGFLSGGTGYGAIINGQLVPILQNEWGWRGIWLATGSTILFFTFAGALVFWLKGIVDESGGQTSSEASNVFRISHLDRSTLKRAVHLWIMMLLGAAVTISFQTFFTALIREDLGADRLLAGRLTFIHGCIGIVASVLIGLMADRFGVRRSFIVVVVCALSACALMSQATSIYYAIISSLFFGFAFYPFFALPPAYFSKTMESKVAVMVFAVGNIFVGLGALLGNLSGGIILRFFDDLSTVFIWLSALSLVLLALVIALPPERED